MPKFIFYYGDETKSIDEPVSPLNIQLILQHTKHNGWHFVSRSDYYVKVGDEYVGVDLFGALDYMMAQGHLLAGRTIPDDIFAKITEDAIKDRDNI